MNRLDWQRCTNRAEAIRRAGGRRRYNRMRAEKVHKRRMAIVGWLGKHLEKFFMPRGVPQMFAPQFGVHPSTIWRDLQVICYGGVGYRFCPSDALPFTVILPYPGGPIWEVVDDDDRPIKGPIRRAILRSVRNWPHRWPRKHRFPRQRLADLAVDRVH